MCQKTPDNSCRVPGVTEPPLGNSRSLFLRVCDVKYSPGDILAFWEEGTARACCWVSVPQWDVRPGCSWEQLSQPSSLGRVPEEVVWLCGEQGSGSLALHREQPWSAPRVADQSHLRHSQAGLGLDVGQLLHDTA